MAPLDYEPKPPPQRPTASERWGRVAGAALMVLIAWAILKALGFCTSLI
jgi:hypothetical protein